MHNMDKLRKMIEKEIDTLSVEDNLSLSSLEKLHKLTSTLKNIDKIEMLEEGGGYSEAMYSREYSRNGRGNYSRDGEWMAKGTYDGGSSYANRGEHYVRGHYSRDDYSNASYDNMRGRYSRDESKEAMMRKFDMMLGEAKTNSEREAIQKCMEAFENL